VFGFLQNEIILDILLVILLFSSVTKGALLPSKTFSIQGIHLVLCLTYISHRYVAQGRTSTVCFELCVSVVVF